MSILETFWKTHIIMSIVTLFAGRVVINICAKYQRYICKTGNILFKYKKTHKIQQPRGK
jgi:hypothetical protein